MKKRLIFTVCFLMFCGISFSQIYTDSINNSSEYKKIPINDTLTFYFRIEKIVDDYCLNFYVPLIGPIGYFSLINEEDEFLYRMTIHGTTFVNDTVLWEVFGFNISKSEYEKFSNKKIERVKIFVLKFIHENEKHLYLGDELYQMISIPIKNKLW